MTDSKIKDLERRNEELIKIKSECESALDKLNEKTDLMNKITMNDEYSYKLLVARAAIKDQIDL